MGNNVKEFVFKELVRNKSSVYIGIYIFFEFYTLFFIESVPFMSLKCFQHETYLQNCLRHQELFSAMIPEGHQPLVSDCQLFLS